MKTAARPLVPILIIAALALATWCTISGHAKNGHTAEMINSMDILDSLELAAQNPGACKVLIIAACPFASIVDKTSPRFGELSPQARVYCGDANTGIMGVFGLKYPENPIYVTGYVISKARFDHYCARDACVVMDITYLQYLVR